MGDAVPVPPPGFEGLSTEEKIAYVQALWDHISSDVDKMPLTEWQRKLLDERLDDLEKNPDNGIPWEEMQARILRKLGTSGA